MNPQEPTGLLARAATRWLADDPATQVLEAALEWQPKWWSAGLLAVLLIMWLLVITTHRSRRIELAARWRVGLGLLRAAIVAIPVLILMQPHVAARLVRYEPRTVTLLLDHSRSMSVRDGVEASPTSRWQRAVETLVPAMSPVVGVDGSGRPADRPPWQGPRVAAYLFGEGIRPAQLTELTSSEDMATSPRTVIGEALRGLEAKLAGKPTAGVLLLTDGADNAPAASGHPLEAARELARAGIPVHACLVGNERPRELTANVVAEAPFAFADDPVPLRVRVEQQGFGDEVVTVTLSYGEQALATRDVALPAGGEPVVERFEVRPDKPGRRSYRAEVTPLPGELTTDNNTAVAEVQVIDQPVRVLYVERWPRWQYRFLRNAIRRDHRFEPRFVLLSEDPATPAAERQTAAFPASTEELARFDAIVVGDLAPQDLSPQQWQWLHDHVVDDGAGAVFIAGPVHMPASFLDLPVGALLPFERVISVSEEDVEPFQPTIAPLGLHHPLMRLGFGDDPEVSWRRLPTLRWYAGVTDLKPGAVVLAERPADQGREPTPLVVLQRTGRGSVLFVGTDETWRWRYEVGNRYFYGFWAHAIQHVGMPHRVGEFRSVRIATASHTIAPDVPIAVSVALQAGSGAIDGETADTLTLIAQPAEGGSAPASFRLRQAADSPLLYEGDISLPAAGTYRLFIEGYEDRGDALVEVPATGGSEPELADPAVRPALLRQIADLTGGEFVKLDQLPMLIQRLDLSPLGYRWSERIPLWDGWTMLTALAVLLTAEWILRKWCYLP